MADRDELDWIKRNEPWRLKDNKNPEPKEKVKKYTERELYDLDKDEQINLLNSLGITDIPRYENERVKKLLEIQQKSNLHGGD